MKRSWAVLVAVGLAQAGSARADEPATASAPAGATEPVEVRVFGPAGCPDSGAFLALVRSRTARVRAPHDGETATVFRVVFQERPGGKSVGWLVVEDAVSASRAREVSGDSCAEVAGALSLVAALSIDPNARVDLPAPPTPSAAPTPTPTPTTTATPNTATSADRGTTKRAERAWRVSAGVGGELSGRGALTGAVRLRGEIGDERPRLLAPAFGLFVMTTSVAKPANGVVDDSFRWSVAGLDLCPLRFALGAAATLRPCAEGTAGWVSASAGPGTVDPQPRSRPWGTVGALARLDLAVWEPLHLVPYVGVSFPLVRETFQVSPVAVYQAPLAYGGGGVDVAVRF